VSSVSATTPQTQAQLSDERVEERVVVSRRPARFTQADVTRAIRAAKQAGASDVIVAPDGSIVIRLSPGQTDTKTVDDERIVPL
jgi:hypothetical protein